MEIKVSVITTLYNYKKYIRETIESFLSQDFYESEMIIVDDCSTDNPDDIINKYVLSNNNRLVYVKLDKNSGYSRAKNEGIRASKAEIVVMLDADDMLTTNGISSRYKKILEGYDFVHGPVVDFIHGKYTESRMAKKWLKTNSPKWIHAQGVMLKKQIHREIGLYDEDLRCKSDREMFYRIYNHGYKIGWVKKTVSIYRKHKKQMHKSKEKMDNNDKLQEIVKKKIKIRKYDLSGLLML